MGCDIHGHVEVKINGRWKHFSHPPIPRSYKLFERICGVRGDVVNAIAPPREMPKDCNIVTQTCCDLAGENGHSHTWLTDIELDALINWFESEPMGDDMFQHHHFGYLEGGMFVERDPVFEDVRFICWFDN